MTSTPVQAPPAGAVRDLVAARAPRRRFVRQLLVSGAWFWGVWAVFVAGVPAAIDRWGGDMVGLTYELAGAPARWVALAVGAVVTDGVLRLHLAAGGTRRSLVTGATTGAALVGPLFGVMAVLLTLGEERVFDGLDRPWPGGATPLPLESVTNVVVTVAGESLVVVTYTLVGVAAVAAVALARTRLLMFGAVLFPALLIPCVLADLATRTGIFATALRGGYHDVVLGIVGTLGGGLLAAALAVLLARRLLHHVQLRP
ncbi:hypothetical protein ACNHYB_13260 [Isoptericola jiangsuensis]|uniref:hypothetical protein n=1 Tax=Isoptericola jiangsuensis TaxID=548579 RepID=UPI003AAEE0E2